ncbi:MAG: hypothetical protein IPH80_09815 [Myxococcales bacterium]|nr:hypothetical protein [Myxococcales bacterium]MBP6846611.1 hypothetical protein [Kofleriaceae bacterium]
MTWAGEGVASPARTRRRATQGATLLPDPERAVNELIRRHGLTPPIDYPGKAWEVAVDHVVDATNEVTAALRNDLPTPERRDAAVLWEVWRKAVLQVRDSIRGLAEDELFLAGSVVWAMRDLAVRHAEALRHPGQVADRYCPWSVDFFTLNRLYPGVAQ